MLTDSLRLKLDYERTRLNRYGRDVKTATYTEEEYLEAYNDWVTHPYGREHLWDLYCDVRDRVPMGTNATIRRRREEAHYH